VLSEQNIEAEMSYAYLHAIATRAGFACEYAGRHLDGAGVDATVYEDGRLLAPDSQLQAFTLHVQLKATRVPPVEQVRRFSFSLPIGQYNRLRSARLATPRILVVLYLPTDPQQWLRHSEDSLVAQRCAYWVSLLGAPDSPNETTQTVYVPRQQMLSPSGLTDLMTRCSRQEELLYAA
jgi:hypothetical protein